MHFCIFNLSCYALLKANVYIFQSCTWLLTLFPTFSFLNSKSGISKGSFGRSFVLFNFQDFFYCRFRQLLYSITSFRFCQALFSNFFKFFFQACLSTWCDVYLLYHVFFRLSSPFSRFFRSFFKLFSRLTWQLIYITTFSFFCQHFSCTFGTIYTFNTLFNTNHKSFSIKNRLKKQLIDYKR